MAPERTKKARERMVRQQVAARGVTTERVLAALRTVPREKFVTGRMAEFAYEDTPLPIGEGQTISQPFIVALMTEMLDVGPDDRVLEIGTGSGYAAAVMSRVAGEVYTIERHASLAQRAEKVFEDLGYDNIHVRVGDGTKGWTDFAPYDGIVVTAGGPEVPKSLRRQLAVGGRMIIPVGATLREQRLKLVTRTGEGTDDSNFRIDDLGGVRFVPLIGDEGWQEPGTEAAPSKGQQAVDAARGPKRRGPMLDLEQQAALPERLARVVEPFRTIESADLGPLLDRIGDARIVALGEATHGTDEFYRMRARITQALVEEKGFDIVALEADWPDAATVDHFVRHKEGRYGDVTPFTRFPTWMWRNTAFAGLVRWLREHNDGRGRDAQVGVYGLDLYSMHTSIGAVLNYLEETDPKTAQLARERYSCLTPWQRDPAAYGRAALTGQYGSCENDVLSVLTELLDKRMELVQEHDGEALLDALQNARVVANSERYYRIMYYGSAQSWNLRDSHMFETLQAVMSARRSAGGSGKAVIWAHNSHLGDASVTEMGQRGEHNLGQLCREKFEGLAYLVGFGTHTGTVAAASGWGGEMEIKKVRPSHKDSYERVAHATGVKKFLLPVSATHGDASIRAELMTPRIQRAIGVIYRPQTELLSHYFQATLPRQFDEYIWFDETQAVTPLAEQPIPRGVPETYPFSL